MLLRHFPNGILILVDRDLRYTIADGTELARTGRTAAQLEGKTIWENYPPEVASYIEPFHRRALAGEPVSYEATVNGRTYFVQGEPVLVDGVVVAAVFSTQETTEMRRKLGELQERDRVLFEHLPGTAVSVLDSELRFTYLSKSIEDLGWSREDLLGVSIREVLPEDSPLLPLYEAALAGEEVSLDHDSLRGGRRMWLQIVPLRGADGNVVGAMSIGQDITDRVTAEVQLKVAKEEFESAFRHATIGMALVDLDGSWLKVNDALCMLVGYPGEELLELTFQAITHPSDLDADLRLVEQLVAGEIDSYQLEKRYLRKDGSIVPVLLSVSLVRDDEGRPVRFISQIQDRSNEVQRRLLEQELSERRRADSLNVLAAGVAHDFNNSLVGILGHTSLALGEVSEGRVRRHLEQIEESARHVADVTAQMLAFTGKAWVDLVDLDLGRHAQELCDQARVAYPKPSIRVSVSPGVPLVRADAVQLGRITASLVENAVEAIEGSGGVVSISTGAVHLTQAALDSYDVGSDAVPGPFAYLEVADNGHGMTEQVHSQMFEPFFTTKFQGRGLGLSVVDGLIRGHGGALAVETVPGKGTRVRVFLPAT